MFQSSFQPYQPLRPVGFGSAAESMDTDSTRLASQGADIVSSLIVKGIDTRSARKLEEEKRKTAKVTKKYDTQISASKAKQEEAKAKAAAAEAEARKAEAEQAAKAQMAKYIAFGGAAVATVLAGVLIAKTLKRK